nr:uncharacterized protein LOC110371173 [Helicoverpa armigera]
MKTYILCLLIVQAVQAFVALDQKQLQELKDNAFARLKGFKDAAFTIYASASKAASEKLFKLREKYKKMLPNVHARGYVATQETSGEPIVKEFSYSTRRQE